MSNLEDFIKDNRSQFDALEPSPSHVQRFEKKLQPKRSTSPVAQFWWAAAVIIGFVVLIQLPQSATNDTAIQSATMSLGDISPEMAEVELYYSEQIQSRQSEAKTLNPKASETLEQQLEKLEENYAELVHELNATDGDERVVRVMIENYRLRLQILEMHLDRIQESNTNRLEK